MDSLIDTISNDFNERYEFSKPLYQMNLVYQLFEPMVADKLISKIFDMINQSGLPTYLYKKELNDLGKPEITIDMNKVIKEIISKEDPQLELEKLMQMYQSKEPYIKWVITREIYKEAENDLIAAIILTRMEKGFTTHDIAKQLNIENEQIVRIEERKEYPTLDMINKLVSVLNKKLKLI